MIIINHTDRKSITPCLGRPQVSLGNIEFDVLDEGASPGGGGVICPIVSLDEISPSLPGSPYLNFGIQSCSFVTFQITKYYIGVNINSEFIPYDPNISPDIPQTITFTLNVTITGLGLIGTIDVIVDVYSPNPLIATNNFGRIDTNPYNIITAPKDINQYLVMWNEGTGEEEWSLSCVESTSSGWVTFSKTNGTISCDGQLTEVYVDFLLSKFQESDEQVSATIFLKDPENNIIKQWVFNFVFSRVYFDPPNLIADIKKTKSTTKTAQIFSISNDLLSFRVLNQPSSWYSFPRTQGNLISPVDSFSINFSSVLVGSYTDTVLVQINKREVPGTAGIVATLELPINLNVTADSLSNINAGPDTVVLPGEFSRTGSVTTTADSFVPKWECVGDNISFTYSDSTLNVNFPPITGEIEYKDYVFKYSATCNSCEPYYVEDSCLIRVSNYIISSFSVVPNAIDIDLNDINSQTITLSTIVVPSNVNIRKYEWTDSADNPDRMVTDSQRNNSTVTLSGWRIPGSYKINCLITTSIGQFLAHSDIVVLGTSSSTIIGSRQSFPDEDDIYDIDSFITTSDGIIEPNSDSGYTLDTLQSIPYLSKRQCINPSICVAHNNKLSGSGEQTFYIAYQSFNINKWEIYLRQIRLSDKNPVQPKYEYPYNYSGIAHDFEISTKDTSTFESSDIDISTSKKYRINGNKIEEYDFNSVIATTYTHTDDIETIRIDNNVTPTMIYFSTKPYVDGSFFTANIFRAEITDIAGTKTEIEEVTEDNFNYTIDNIRISQNYIYWIFKKSETEYFLVRKQKSLAYAKEFYKSIGAVDTPVLGSPISMDVDYVNNTIFFRAHYVSGSKLNKINFSYSIEPDMIDLTESISYVLTESTYLCIDYRNRNLYLSDPYREKITRIDYIGNNQQDRIKSTEINKILRINDTDVYWLEETSVFSIMSAPLYFSLSSPEIYTYYPKEMYVIKYKDESGENSYITRIVYNLLLYSNYRVIKADKYGYYKDIEITISYSGDLSYYWYSDKTVFEFNDNVSVADGSNLTNLPFDLHLYPPIYISDAIFGDLLIDDWLLVPNEGSIQFQKDNFGYCGTEVVADSVIAKSNGNCINPKITCNYDNELILVYEDTESLRNQIKIISTGDLGKSTINGPSGSYVSNFFSYNDFKFYHMVSGLNIYSTNVNANYFIDTVDGSITTNQQTFSTPHNKVIGENSSINQRPDIVVDKNNIIHLTWQSNRDNYWEIYYANSENLFDPVRITKVESVSSMPSIAINNDGNVFIAFHDDRFNNKQIFVVYKEQERVIPLFQQNEYLASFDNDYSHYINNLQVPVSNIYDNSYRIHVFLKFFENRLLAGSPIQTISTRDNPDMFTSENETSISGGIDNGVFVSANDTVYIMMIGGTALSNLKKNQTYFVKIEYLYPDNSLVEVIDTHLSYSCTICGNSTEATWISSGSGYSDTRITYSSKDAIAPKIKTKQYGKLIVLWTDFRDTQNIMGASFNLSDDLRSSGGNWFDYNYNVFDGKNFSMELDLFDRQSIVYEKIKTEGTKTLINSNYIAYKTCDMAKLPSPVDVSQEPVCDFSNITSNVLTDDPYIGSKYVKLIKVIDNYVNYYTRNTSGDSIPVISNCSIKLELTGTPEVVAYRIKNENETVYSNWYPFSPIIGSFYTEIDHIVSPNSGLKETCIQVATYSGVTAKFSIPIIADYEPAVFDVALSSSASEFPIYNNAFVVSTGQENSINLQVYIVVSPEISSEIESGKIGKPYFDFIQQGLNDQYGILTEKTEQLPKLPAGISFSGVFYTGSVKIYKHDGKYNSDGISQIKVHLGNECVSSGTVFSTIQTKDIFNYYGKTLIAENTEDSLVEYRNSQTGQIGIVPDYTVTDQENVFADKYSIRFNRTDNYIKLSHTDNLPIWNNTGYTISMWVKHPMVNGVKIFAETPISSFVFYCAGTNKLSILLPDISGTIKTSSKDVFDNVWHHLCWIDNNGTSALYIDGIKDSTDFNYVSDSVLGKNNIYTSLGSSLNVGGVIPSGCLTGGNIDEFSAWNKALNPSDVEKIYNNGIPGDLTEHKSNMVVWLRMGEKTRWRNGLLTLVDESGNDNYGTLYNLTGNDIVSEIPS